MAYLDIFNRKEVKKLKEIIKQLEHENNHLRQEVEKKTNDINLLNERISKFEELSNQKDNEISELKINFENKEYYNLLGENLGLKRVVKTVSNTKNINPNDLVSESNQRKDEIIAGLDIKLKDYKEKLNKQIEINSDMEKKYERYDRIMKFCFGEQSTEKTILSMGDDSKQASREEFLDLIYQLCERFNIQEMQHIFNYIINKKKDKEAEALKQKEKSSELIFLLRKIFFSIRPINSLTDLLSLSAEEYEIITVKDLKEIISNLRVGQINLNSEHIPNHFSSEYKHERLRVVINHTEYSTSFSFYKKVFEGINNFEDALMAYCINTPEEKALLYKERLMRFYKLTQESATDDFLEGLDNLISNKYLELKNTNYLVQQDIPPKKSYENTDQYIFRILKGISDYNQAVLILANCAVYPSISNFGIHLIAKGIIPEDFDKNLLFEDLKKASEK